MDELEMLYKKRKALQRKREDVMKKQRENYKIKKLKSQIRREEYALKKPKTVAFLKGAGKFASVAAKKGSEASVRGAMSLKKAAEKQAAIQAKQKKTTGSALKDLI